MGFNYDSPDDEKKRMINDANAPGRQGESYTLTGGDGCTALFRPTFRQIPKYFLIIMVLIIGGILILQPASINFSSDFPGLIGIALIASIFRRLFFTLGFLYFGLMSILMVFNFIRVILNCNVVNCWQGGPALFLYTIISILLSYGSLRILRSERR